MSQFLILSLIIYIYASFPGGSNGKESAQNAGDLGSIPVLGRSPGEGNGSPLQYSCLGNPIDRGAWQATVHGVTKSQTRLRDYHHIYLCVDVYIICASQVARVVKNPPNAGDLKDSGSIPGLGRSLGEGNGNPL